MLQITQNWSAAFSLSKTTNFGLFQIGRVCRRQFHILMKEAEKS